MTTTINVRQQWMYERSLKHGGQTFQEPPLRMTGDSEANRSFNK